MFSKSFEKLQENEELRINFGIEKRDLVDSEADTEVVYKPTTMDKDGIWNPKIQNLKPEIKEKPKNSVFLYRTAFIANLLGFAAGVGFSWTSPVIPKLQSRETPLKAPVDASQESIIAAILCIGAAIGPFPCGYLADKIGRKRTLVVIAIPMVVALVILAFTDEVKMYYLARLLYGTGNGGVFTVLTMYIAEITEDHNRGQFCCIMGIFIASGLLYPLSIGPLLSIRTFCLSSLIPLQIFLIFFPLYCPESPTYLLKIDKSDLAATALKDLRNKSEDQVEKELKALQIIVENQKQEKGGIAEIFRNKATKKAFIVATGLLTIQQVSGINAVTGFMENIFLATGSAVPSKVATTFIGIIQVLTVLVTASVIEKLGRKFLILSSIIGAAVSIIFLGLYFFLHRSKFSMLAYFWWLPIVCLLVYIVSFNLGLGPVPWTVLSEIFPNNVKASASALVSSTCFGISFVITMAFPILSEILGMAETFWTFGICCILGLLFVYYIVPETKGKTLAEIQEILSH